MHLHELTDENLWSSTLRAAADEKKATLILLEHLTEIYRRRLFAARGYGSLFEYVFRELGFSEAQASDRINAARLISQVEGVKEKIESGSLTLTAASKIQRFFKTENPSLEEKKTLIEKCESKPTREVERILLENQENPIPKESVRLVTAERMELKFSISCEIQAKLQDYKNIVGHDLTLEKIFENGLDALLEKHAKKSEKPTRPVALAPASVKKTRYVTKADRAALAERSQNQCEFQDPITQRRCESRYKLQVEHRVPFSLGGETELGNLAHYCPVHNQLAAIQVLGREKMQNYVPGIGVPGIG